MNREDIIRMAREAGFNEMQTNAMVFGAILERFAALVAAAEADRIANESKHIIKRAEARGAAAEREECASMAEAFHHHQYDFTGNLELHEAIRARGQA